jgi:hypothetical protein
LYIYITTQILVGFTSLTLSKTNIVKTAENRYFKQNISFLTFAGLYYYIRINAYPYGENKMKLTNGYRTEVAFEYYGPTDGLTAKSSFIIQNFLINVTLL